MSFIPQSGSYDYELGIDPDIINYVRESHQIQSTISGTPCYLFFRNASGSVEGSSGSLLPLDSFYQDSNSYYRGMIWPSGSLPFPDLRDYTNSGSGSVFVYIDGVPANRLINVEDLLNDNEFVIDYRQDITPFEVDVVFNKGFNPTSHTIQFYYETTLQGENSVRFKRGESGQQSIFGWTQYLSSYSDFARGVNQILVRLPITPETLGVNEEGKVALESNQSWMVWTPYVHNYDILIFPNGAFLTGTYEVYEIVEKNDSVMQGVATMQRFKLRLLDFHDDRYNLEVQTI